MYMVPHRFQVVQMLRLVTSMQMRQRMMVHVVMLKKIMIVMVTVLQSLTVMAIVQVQLL